MKWNLSELWVLAIPGRCIPRGISQHDRTFLRVLRLFQSLASALRRTPKFSENSSHGGWFWSENPGSLLSPTSFPSLAPDHTAESFFFFSATPPQPHHVASLSLWHHTIGFLSSLDGNMAQAPSWKVIRCFNTFPTRPEFSSNTELANASHLRALKSLIVS